MSQFKPNDPRINRAGRPKGSRNKNALREKVEYIIDSNIDNVQEWLNDMEPKDRANFILRLLEYSLPKLRSQEFKTDLESLTDEDLDKLLNRLIDEQN